LAAILADRASTSASHNRVAMLATDSWVVASLPPTTFFASVFGHLTGYQREIASSLFGDNRVHDEPPFNEEDQSAISMFRDDRHDPTQLRAASLSTSSVQAPCYPAVVAISIELDAYSLVDGL
jgi:hypothetical protein